jgi:hypothetical protein
MKTFFVSTVILISASLLLAAPRVINVPTPAALHGKVVVKQVKQLQRFPQPVVAHPSIHPPVQVGRSWHWHPHYGWVALPVGVVNQVLLPANYVLPEPVTVYESAVADPSQTLCPHCGQPIIIQIR